MASSSKSSLRLGWCSYEAAKYACKTWYARSEMPAGKLARVGIWENENFIGVMIFGTGANKNLASSVGLEMTECCELVRVAIAQHDSPVSRIMGIALRLVQKEFPGLKAVVSYCDPSVGHYGGIYQATNWVYVGETKPVDYYRDDKGELHHWKTARGLQKKGVKLEKIYFPGKHKYVYPFSLEMREQLKSRALPYPKLADETGDRPDQG